MRDRVAEAAQREIDRRASMTVVLPASGDGMIVVEFGPEATGMAARDSHGPGARAHRRPESAAAPPAPESEPRRAVMHIPRSEALDRLADLRLYLDEILASREENG